MCYAVDNQSQKNCFDFCLNDIDLNVMHRLTENQTVHAIGMLQAELAHNIVARQYGVHHNTIQSLLMRIRQYGNTKNRHLNFAHRITT